MAIKDPNKKAIDAESAELEKLEAATSPSVDDMDVTALRAALAAEKAKSAEQAAALKSAAVEYKKLEAQTDAAEQGWINAAMLNTNSQPMLVEEREVEVETYNKRTKKTEVSTKMVNYYKYRVDLAPNGGDGITINDMKYYHGREYTVSEDTLRTLRDISFRTWKHEASISGKSDENFYRQPSGVSMNTGRGLPDSLLGRLNKH